MTTRKSKRDKPEHQIRAELAGNVAALRDVVYKALPSVTARNRRLSEEAQCSLSQVQRIIQMKLGASIDMIAKLSRALKVRPQDLLTPYFAYQTKEKGEVQGEEAEPFRPKRNRRPPIQ